MSKLNILDVNVCDIPNCSCGWNIHIGSDDYELFEELIEFLKQKRKERNIKVVDCVDYSKKLGDFDDLRKKVAL